MKVSDTALAGVKIVEPQVFKDSRGATLETWHASLFREAGLPYEFAQDLVSVSHRGVVRGLHFQHPHPQGKLVTVLQGSILDVVVDIRKDSPTFGRWIQVEIFGPGSKVLVIPGGFAHGFQVTSEQAIVAYKLTDVYHRGCEGGVSWNDPDLNIPWPLPDPILSDKDRAHPRLREIPQERLPR